MRANAARERPREPTLERAAVPSSPPQRALTPQLVTRLQASAGNAAVVRLLRQPGPGGGAGSNVLSAQAAAKAAAATNKLYGPDSIRWIEALVGLTPDGVYTDADAEAVARTQQRVSLTPTGEMDVPFLDGLISQGASTDALRNQLISLAIDRAGIDVSQALEVGYDPALTAASGLETFPGGVSRIRIGATAFTGYAGLLAEIKKQLKVKPHASPATAVPAGTLDDPAKQQDAIAFDKARLPDRRSILLVQGQTGSKATGVWDADAVRHLAALQQTLGLPGDGKLDQRTLEAMAATMIGKGHHNALLHLIVDYYDLDRSHAFNVFYEPNQWIDPADGSRANGQSQRAHPSMGVGGMAIIYPEAFSQPFAQLVHVVAHELGHVDQVMQGIASIHVREFLSECIEIESSGMPWEAIEPSADITSIANTGMSGGKTGFMDDAMTMYRRWQAMSTAEKRQHVARFRQVRAIIFNRIRREADQAQLAALKQFVEFLFLADQGL